MPPLQQPPQPGQTDASGSSDTPATAAPGPQAGASAPQQQYVAYQQPQYQAPAAQTVQPVNPAQPSGNNIQVITPPVAHHQPSYRPPQLQPLSTQPKPPETPSQPENGGSPYDFFLEEKKQPKKPGLVPAGGPMSGFTKILIGAGAAMAVMAVLAIGLTASRGSSDNTTTGLNGIAQSQQEIIRVAGLAEDTVVSQDLLNYTATAIGALTSEQQKLIDFSAKNGGTINTKQLELTADSKTDAALDAAKAASTYDTTYRSIMKQLVTTYQSRSQTAYNASTTAGARDILDKNLTSAKLLLQMLSVNDPTQTTSDS